MPVARVTYSRHPSVVVHGLHDKPAVVLDLGASYVKAGHAGDAAPRIVLPSPRVLKVVDYDGKVPPVCQQCGRCAASAASSWRRGNRGATCVLSAAGALCRAGGAAVALSV
jgi:hypothetical protein